MTSVDLSSNHHRTVAHGEVGASSMYFPLLHVLLSGGAGDFRRVRLANTLGGGPDHI
jgi:hypothetical protein